MPSSYRIAVEKNSPGSLSCISQVEENRTGFGTHIEKKWWGRKRAHGKEMEKDTWTTGFRNWWRSIEAAAQSVNQLVPGICRALLYKVNSMWRSRGRLELKCIFTKCSLRRHLEVAVQSVDLVEPNCLAKLLQSTEKWSTGSDDWWGRHKSSLINQSSTDTDWWGHCTRRKSALCILYHLVELAVLFMKVWSFLCRHKIPSLLSVQLQ